MKKYYTIKTNVGPMLKDIPILEIKPIVCNAQWQFLRDLFHSKKISYTNFFGGESLNVKDTNVSCSPISSELRMPIIVDEEFVDVITNKKIDCKDLLGQYLYSEFVTIDQELDIIYVEHLIQDLEKNGNSIELYEDAVDELISLLKKYKEYSDSLKSKTTEKETTIYIECQKEISAAQSRIRKRLEERKRTN